MQKNFRNFIKQIKVEFEIKTNLADIHTERTPIQTKLNNPTNKQTDRKINRETVNKILRTFKKAAREGTASKQH